MVKSDITLHQNITVSQHLQELVWFRKTRYYIRTGFEDHRQFRDRVCHVSEYINIINLNIIVTQLSKL